MITLDPMTTALVLIDLQNGVLEMPLQPHAASAVVSKAKELASRLRAAGGTVVLVRVAFSDDQRDLLSQPVDLARPVGARPPSWSEIVEGLAQPADLRITKRQWGAFYGTELDLQLRRRGVRSIVLGGVATNIGVESTARQAYEHGYALVLAEDATSGVSAEMHEFAVRNIFPRLSRVAQSDGISFAG